MRTPLCDRLGIELPIVQAPVGSAAAPELVAAVSAAGGLGLLALTWQSPAQARRSIRRVRELTDRPFGANLVLDFGIDDLLTVCLDERVPVVSTAAGGIADGRGLAAALALGAQGAWLGTRFLTAAEAFTHDVYAGQSVQLVQDVRPAAELIDDIAARAAAIVRGLGSRLPGEEVPAEPEPGAEDDDPGDA